LSHITQYDGLTWDHPRGFEPLDATATNLTTQGGQLRIRWHKQSLEGFESHPIADLAQRYDLMIIDHPCLGEAAANDCFVPFTELFSKEECETWRKATVGPSYSSYCYAGTQWAMPLDAATQVCVLDPQRIEEDLWPKTWEDVLELSRRHPMVLSLAGPHALLSLFSICAQICEDENLPGEDDIFNEITLQQAYKLLTSIYHQSDKQYTNYNPIAILDAMASGADIAFCPLIYGYVSYAYRKNSSQLKQLIFINAPRFTNEGKASSTIGGTGLAVSRKTKITDTLLEHLRYLMSTKYQLDFVPNHGGQPSYEVAWRDREVNQRVNDFYCNTLETITNAWVRPRYNGYVEFQALASALVREALAEGRPAHDVSMKIKALQNECRIPCASQEVS